MAGEDMETAARAPVQDLLAIQATAFAEGSYAAAYHLLLAILHFGDSAGDEVTLKRVEHLAAQQRAELDRLEPHHPLATRAAHIRGQTPLFASAELHARAALARSAGSAAIERSMVARDHPRGGK